MTPCSKCGKQRDSRSFCVYCQSPGMGDTIGKNQCRHGSLARSCEICELQAEVDRLTAENAKLRAVVVAAKNYCDQNGHPQEQGCMQDHQAGGPCDCGYMEIRKALHALEGK